MFTLAGLLGVVVTIAARSSRSFRLLDAEAHAAAAGDGTDADLVPAAA
jgi:hypothetical protein